MCWSWISLYTPTMLMSAEPVQHKKKFDQNDNWFEMDKFAFDR